MSKEKKKKELSKQEMKKVSGGMRGPGELEELERNRDDIEATPQEADSELPMGNRPIDISRRVQGNWRPR